MAALGVAGLLRDIGNATFEMHPLLTSYLRSRENAAPEPYQRAFVDVMGRLADGLAQRELHEQRIPFLVHGTSFHFALGLAERLSMDQPFGALTQSLAAYAKNTRNFNEAFRLFERLARHWAALGRAEGEAVAYHQLGMIAQDQRDFAAAREWYLNSLAIKERQGNLQGAARTYNQLGMVGEEQRDFAAAREWYLKSLAIEEKQGNLRGAAITHHQLGIIAHEQRDFAAAREWYLKSLAISERLAIEQYAAGSYHQLGIVAKEQGEFAAAREWCLKSLAIWEKQGDLHHAASTYGQLGILAQKQREFATAREWYLKSLAIDEKQGHLHGAAGTYGQLGIIAGLQGSFEDCGRWLARCISSFLQTNDQHAAQRNIDNFLVFHQHASPADKLKLEAIWHEASLGDFPKEPTA
jgi:tetratricopeptide (TPR) repeat protein